MPYRRNYRQKGKLRKRWYLNAGATLPFVGKTQIRMGNLQKRSIINTVRKGLEDPLHKVIAGAQQACTQSTHYTLNLLGNIARGDTGADRTGDNIHLDALKFNMLFSNNGATNLANEKILRIMIVKADAEVLGASDAWGSGLGSTDLYQDSASLPVFACINPKLVTKVYDKCVRLIPQGAVQSLTRISELIPINQRFTYKSGTNFGKQINYYMVINIYEPGATSGTTNVGLVYLSTDLIFKDSK